MNCLTSPSATRCWTWRALRFNSKTTTSQRVPGRDAQRSRLSPRSETPGDAATRYQNGDTVGKRLRLTTRTTDFFGAPTRDETGKGEPAGPRNDGLWWWA